MGTASGQPDQPDQPGWRERWARREDARRQRAYRAAWAHWQDQHEQARWLVETATESSPQPPDESHTALKLHRGEVLYWTAPAVAMVEVPYPVSLDPPDHRGLPLQAVAPDGPGSQPGQPGQVGLVRDTGYAAVTSKRVIFLGRARREWALGKLIGLRHATAGSTLMLVSNRKQASGLRPPAAQLPGFRLALTLALADAAGDRARLTAHLDQQREHHLQLAPPAPAPAQPADAPASARFGPGVLIALAASVILFVSLCCVGNVLVGNPDRAAESAGLVPTSAPALVAPTPTRRLESSPTPVASPTPAPATTRPPAAAPPPPPPAAAPPPPPPPPAPKPPPPAPAPVDLCGAPTNPYGFHYCGSGSLITDPPGDICSYFECIGNFWNGQGHMIECNDGMVSMSGGRSGSCSHHGGNSQPVRQ